VASYDLITVGGGLGGASLAMVMARRGARVLVVERETRFADRVRGEALAPWGVAAARAIGIYPRLQSTPAHALRWFDTYFAGAQVAHRDIPSSTPQAEPWLAFYHPAMQETVLDAARAAGAEVRRGARVRGGTPGRPPQVVVDDEVLTARLVIGADGRNSMVRRWAEFDVHREPERHLFSGVLFDGLAVPDDTSAIFFTPRGRISLLFPQGGGRVRAYVGFHRAAGPPAAADYDMRRFIAESVDAGTPSDWYQGAESRGPLAIFDATDSWVPHPYRDGIALIGDAASTSDPTWGQGMSLTLRDVHTLSDRLASDDDWDAAAHAYAAEHDRYYEVVRRVDGWYSDLFMGVDSGAEAARLRALPLFLVEPDRMVDVPHSGPDMPAGETERRRFFGEE
jgi:menaquinone-9 beta-reductase